jgi:hypothetical protein
VFIEIHKRFHKKKRFTYIFYVNGGVSLTHGEIQKFIGLRSSYETIEDVIGKVFIEVDRRAEQNKELIIKEEKKQKAHYIKDIERKKRNNERQIKCREKKAALKNNK